MATQFALDEIDPIALSNFRQALRSPIKFEFQEFATFFFPEHETLESAMERHEDVILTTIIFSLYSNSLKRPDGSCVFCMRGFIQQENRKPNKFDKIFVFKGPFFKKVRGAQIYSQVAFEIIRGEDMK